MQGSICPPAIAPALARTGLDALEQWFEVRIIPAVVAGLSPLIKIGRMAPDPYHGIDAARATDDLSPRPVDLSSRRFCLRFRSICPIDIGSKIRRPQHRALQRRPADVTAPRLEQQDATGGIFGESRRNRAAGRTSADDNEIIGSCNSAPSWSCQCLICHRCGET